MGIGLPGILKNATVSLKKDVLVAHPFLKSTEL
jgi:hypothetical protein